MNKVDVFPLDSARQGLSRRVGSATGNILDVTEATVGIVRLQEEGLEK